MEELSIGAIALILILIIASYFIGANNSENKYSGEYITYTICPGDTLWSIAENITGDTRYIVYTIKKDNNIVDCGELQIGQQIKLRVEY